MGNYEQLKEAVSNVIKTNRNQEITGSVLQNTLLSIISTIGNNATFAGLALPTTNPGTPDPEVFWIAAKPGLYPNFNGIKVERGYIGVFTILNDGTGWGLNRIFIKEDAILYYTGDIYVDFNSENVEFAGGFLFYSSDVYTVLQHNVSYTTKNLQYIFFNVLTNKFYVQDYNKERVNPDDILCGIIDITGKNVIFETRKKDLGKYQPLYKMAYLVSNSVVVDIKFTKNGGFVLSNTSGLYLTNQADDYKTIDEVTIDKSEAAQSTQYVFLNSESRQIECFQYNEKPNKRWDNMYWIGYINPSKKLYSINAAQITENGDKKIVFLDSYLKKLNDISEQLGSPQIAYLPTNGWIEKDWNSVFGTDGIFFDKRNIIKKTKRLKNIKLVVETAGTVRLHLLNSNFETLFSKDVNLTAGLNNAMINGIEYSTNLYVGIQNITGIVKTIFPADNTGNGFKKTISTGEVAISNFSFAYELEVEDYENTLLGRVENIENKIGTYETIEEFIANGVSNIVLDAKEYTLTETINIPSGTKIVGVRGKTIVNVPSSLKIGFNLKNVEDVVIENITIVGAYNGTPLKSGLQPVKSGIVDSVEDAYNWQGAGYQTNMVDGGVTELYIPQIGININTCEKIEILGCEIKRFSWAGIANRLSGKNYRYAIKVENNYINECYCGIKLYDEAERSQYIANNISMCQMGLFLDSGTNILYGTSFTANRIGMVMSNGWNHAHGEITDCPFTHCSLFGIVAKNIEHGQMFNGCKFGYSDAEEGNFGGYNFAIINSRGLAFCNGKLVNGKTRFDGKFYLHGVSYSIGGTDQFGNEYYTVQYEDVTDQPTNYNGGVNVFRNNSATDALFTIIGDLDNTNVVLKDNFYISGQDSNDLNN